MDPTPQQLDLIAQVVEARNSLAGEIFYPDVGYTVTLHPDDAGGLTEIAGCRVVLDDAMPRGNVAVGYEMPYDDSDADEH